MKPALTTLTLITVAMLQQAQAQSYTLEQAISTALQNNHQKKISALDIQIASAQYKEAMSANFPSLDLQLGYIKRDEDLINVTKGEFTLPQNMSNALALIAAPDAQKPLVQQMIAANMLPPAKIPLNFTSVVMGDRTSQASVKLTYPLYTGGKVSALQRQAKLGKAIAGGFPLTAIAGRGDIMAHMDKGSVDDGEFMPQIGTLSGNPVAAVAGLKTLEILRREGTYDRIFATGARIKNALQKLLDEAEIPAKVIGEASLFDVFFTESDVTDYRSTLEADPVAMARFNSSLLEQGVFKGASKFYISAAHSDQDVEETIAAFETAVELLKG